MPSFQTDPYRLRTSLLEVYGGYVYAVDIHQLCWGLAIQPPDYFQIKQGPELSATTSTRYKARHTTTNRPPPKWVKLVADILIGGFTPSRFTWISVSLDLSTFPMHV